MNKNKIAALGTALLLAAGSALASGGADLRMAPPPVNPLDTPSLQRGARDFMNYCLGCHSAKYMRFNRLTDLGLTEQQVVENLVLTGRFDASNWVPTKPGDTMQIAMRAPEAKAWFGAPPPDLSVESRVRGDAWLYNYLRAFYRDEKSATGWNNLVFPNVGMPNVLWEYSGVNRLVQKEFEDHEQAQAAALQLKGLVLTEPAPGGKTVVKWLETDTPGSVSPADFDGMVADIVNFMDYVAEPAKVQRSRLGIVVLLFLGVLFALAYWLKREYWKDVH
jgi:ubiquinol-cytochrome c reductase cytochrome c1 subunit